MKDENQNAVARTFAEEEFDRFVDCMDLDVEPRDPEEAADVATHRARIVKAIERGDAIVNEVGEITFTPARSGSPKDPITFYEPRGSAWQATEQAKKNKTITSLHFMLAEITRKPPAYFAKLQGSDYKFCQSVVSLFLA